MDDMEPPVGSLWSGANGTILIVIGPWGSRRDLVSNREIRFFWSLVYRDGDVWMHVMADAWFFPRERDWRVAPERLL